MIVALNGPFGAGKTTVARLLVARLPRARLYNPEQVGTVVRAVMRPFGSVPDYQDLALWRILAPWAARLLAAHTDGALVIPMTVWRRDYCEQWTGRLRRIDPDLHCVQLTASEAVLRQRIAGRPEAQTWCIAHLESGLAMAGDPRFGSPISTDGRSPAEVADAIAALLKG